MQIFNYKQSSSASQTHTHTKRGRELYRRDKLDVAKNKTKNYYAHGFMIENPEYDDVM